MNIKEYIIVVYFFLFVGIVCSLAYFKYLDNKHTAEWLCKSGMTTYCDDAKMNFFQASFEV